MDCIKLRNAGYSVQEVMIWPLGVTTPWGQSESCRRTETACDQKWLQQQWSSSGRSRLCGLTAELLLQTITLKYNVSTYLLADAQLDEVAYKAEHSKKSPDWKYYSQKSSVTPTVGGWRTELRRKSFSSCISWFYCQHTTHFILSLDLHLQYFWINGNCCANQFTVHALTMDMQSLAPTISAAFSRIWKKRKERKKEACMSGCRHSDMAHETAQGDKARPLVPMAATLSQSPSSTVKSRRSLRPHPWLQLLMREAAECRGALWGQFEA